MLNENIKAIRKSKGLSQQELAVMLNVAADDFQMGTGAIGPRFRYADLHIGSARNAGEQVTGRNGHRNGG